MKKFCVIGSPISHSLSPRMHNAAFKELGIDATYEAATVAPENLPAFIETARSEYEGFNVTIPHKETIIKYLDEVDDRARTIGAVNTVVNEGGRLIGYNTDWIGFTEALLEGAGEPSAAFLQYKPALVIGAGGAARAICFATSHLGAKLYITNRTFEKAQHLAEEFSGIALRLNELEKIDPLLVVNVTSVGMAPHINESAVPNGMWNSWKYSALRVASCVAFDCVYTPRETQFLKDAHAAGFKTITGENMLIHQGAAAFELFTGKKAPIEVMRSAIFA